VDYTKLPAALDAELEKVRAPLLVSHDQYTFFVSHRLIFSLPTFSRPCFWLPLTLEVILFTFPPSSSLTPLLASHLLHSFHHLTLFSVLFFLRGPFESSFLFAPPHPLYPATALLELNSFAFCTFSSLVAPLTLAHGHKKSTNHLHRLLVEERSRKYVSS